MSLAIVYSRASFAMSAPLVTVEAHLSTGTSAFNIVGLPEAAVKESKHRVRSAILNSHFEFPSRRITINLAPADLPKEGGRFDLPIALGILAASRQIPKKQLLNYEWVGELALSGELRPIRGVLPVVLEAKKAKRLLIVPHYNAEEAGLLPEAQVFYAKHLLDVCQHLKAETPLNFCQVQSINKEETQAIDLSDVRGQSHAKRALEIAAAGKHSLLFIGPPGTGKTMLASRLASLLPPLNNDQALEVAAVASISTDGLNPKHFKRIPFRAPHHSSSSIALVGGGRPPKPGEISLAHHGVLFLDELPEFNRNVLEALREPLESGYITISRAGFQVSFPAQFQLIAAMNPCPCGYAGSKVQYCRCREDQVLRYQAKLSGPLLDRLDMQVEVAALSPELLSTTQNNSSEKSALIRARVLKARAQQYDRQGKENMHLTVPDLDRYQQLEKSAERLLHHIVKKFNLSPRVYHRLIKVGRTIADLEGSPTICENHLAEAFSYRYFDRIKTMA